MFKKMLIVCAGLIITTKTASAQIFASVQQTTQQQPTYQPAYAPAQQPTYQPVQQAPAQDSQTITFVGELDGKPLVLQVVPGNGYAYTGQLFFGGEPLPCDGENHQGQVTGTVHGPNGKHLTFTGVLQNGGIQLTSGKAQAFLRRADSNTPAQQPQQPAPVIRPTEVDPGYNPQPTPAATQTGATIDRNDVTVVSTQYFNIPMPRGWQHREAKADALVVSPDGMTAYGVIGRQVANGVTPEAFLRDMMNEFRVQNLQIVQQKIVDTGDSDEIIALVTFTGPDGHDRTGIMKAYVLKGKNFAILIHSATPADEFKANGALVAELAGNIGVVKNPTPTAQAPIAQPVGYNPLGR